MRYLSAALVVPTVTLPTMSEVRIPAAALDALVAPDRWSTAPHLAIVAAT